jgi:hypothetical protein
MILAEIRAIKNKKAKNADKAAVEEKEAKPTKTVKPASKKSIAKQKIKA